MPSSTSTLLLSSVEIDGVHELARFELGADGHVTATYQNDVMRRWIEEGLVWTPTTGKVVPHAGELFMQTLPIALSHSSRLRVTKL